MASNYRSDREIYDANLIVQTGATLTAGTLVFADISGTNVVRSVRSYSGATVESSTPATGVGFISMDTNLSSGVFLGVIANTQTGVPNILGGSQTGVTFYAAGIFEFSSTPTSSAALRIGFPVWAADNSTVLCTLSGLTTADATGSNSTGTNPIGVVRYLPRGPIITNTVPQKVGVEIITGQRYQRPA